MSQSDTLGDDSETESAEENNYLRALEARLTKACDHDMKAIRRVTTSKIRKLEDRIEELRFLEKAEIRLQKKALKRKLERLKRGVPIRQLPTEITSYIFCFYVQSDRPPWRLLKVCKGWRQIAMGTPQLWCHIRVTDASFNWDGKLPLGYSPGSLESIKILFEGRILVCVGIPQLQAALRQSGGVPVDIKVKSRCSQSAAIDMILSAISILLGEPVSNRINRLVIDCPSLGQTSTIRDITPGPFTLLTSIELRTSLTTWSLSMFPVISSTSTLLKYVRVDCEIATELANLQMWSRIQDVSLRSIRSRPVAQDLNKISHKLLNITQITRGPISWPSEDTPPSVWRNIQEIDLACDSIHLARLELPTLVSLIVMDMRNWDEEYAMEGFMPVSYPFLYNLKVITSGSRWLSKVSAPLLRQFHIDCGLNNGASAGRGWESSTPFIGCDFPVLRELTFGALVGSEAMISGLSQFSSILKLSLLSPRKDPILAVLLHLESYRPIPCCHLGQLCIGSEEGGLEAFKKEVVSMVKRLIKFRKRIWKPLGRLSISIYWYRGDGTPQAFI